MAKKQKGKPIGSLIQEMIPAFLIMDILSRLPVRDIFTCRRVCKGWHSHLSDPYFIKLHQQNKPISYLALTRFKPVTTSDFYLMEFTKSASDKEIEIVNMKFRTPFKRKAKKMIVSNTCHGFFCLYETLTWNTSYVSNPIIGEYVPIPHTHRFGYTVLRIIIGFDHVTNTYKLLRFLFGMWQKVVVEILVLSDDTSTNMEDPWRKIDDGVISAASFCNGLVGPFLNGNYHHIKSIRTYRSCSFDSICSFDFTSQQFKILPLPSDLEGKDDFYPQIGTLENLLCLGVFFRSESMFQVWSMKEYGVKESWTKMLSIKTHIYCRPIAVYRCGERLLTWKGLHILASCVKKRSNNNSYFVSTEEVVIPKVDLISLFGEVPYSPTFASLKNVTGQYYKNVERGRRVRIIKDIRCNLKVDRGGRF